MQTHNLKMKFKVNMLSIGTDGHQVKTLLQSNSYILQL